MMAKVLLDGRMPTIVGVAALAVWPLVFSAPYDLRLFTLAGIYTLLVLGYQFIFGHAGAFALTQGAFFGLGAYVTGILSTRYGWSFPVTFPLSILVPVVLAALVAAPVLRLQSHYFALATLGIAQVLLLVCLDWESVTGGANGIAGVPGVVLFGAEVPRGLPMAALVWGCVAIGAGLTWQTQRGLYGQAFHAMREDEIAAMSMGLDTGTLRLVAFLLSGAYAGAAGALSVHTLRVLSPEVLELPVMVACLAMAVVGGRNRIAGAFVGAFLLVHLPEWLRSLDKYYLIAYGAVLLAMIVVAPEGIVGTLERLYRRHPPTAKPISPAATSPRQLKTGASAGASVLEISGVRKSFGGVRALDDVSFVLRRGEILGLIGPNGSGKTTLVNIITGHYRSDSGEVEFGGRSLRGLHPFAIARLGISRTFQNIELVDDLPALDNVAIARAAARVGLGRALTTPLRDPVLDRARGEAMYLLGAMGVASEAMRACGDLPHGSRRRVEIARAVAPDPDLILLDEPAAGLNETEQRDLATRLRKLADDGRTLLIIEHNMPFLMRLADRMVCLDSGRVVAVGSPVEVRDHPRVIEAYLGRRTGAEASA